jgi:hypothetical protein
MQQPHEGTALGHEELFPPQRLNARCPFSYGTFAAMHATS